MLRALKEILGGVFVFALGWFFAGTDARFLATSRPASLIVLQTDDKLDHPDGGWIYRQVLGLDTDVRPRPEYSGNTWFPLPLHGLGEIVPGRYDPVSGEMKTDRMLWFSWSSAWIAKILGGWIVLLGLARLFGLRRREE